jgi:hypothetical protein
MLRRRNDILIGTLRRRPAAWVALVGQCAALFGLPLPAVSAKDHSSPFPCQQRQCGCLRAADCWKHCCCFSAQERLAWARAHEAEVPESLVEEARQSEDSKPGACCNVKKTTSSRPAVKTAQGVLGFMARHCQGQHTLWGSSEPAPVPPLAVTWSFEAQPDVCCLFLSWSAPFVSHIPPVPPPRG